MALFTDDFSGGLDGDNISARTGWVNWGGTSQCFINAASQCKCGSGDTGVAHDTGDTDHYAQMVARNTSSGNQLFARSKDSSNLIFVRVNGGTLELRKKVAGSTSGNLTSGGTISTGDIIKIEVIGNSVKIYQNAVQRGTTYTITDSELQDVTATNVGMWGLQVIDPWCDDFEADTIGGGGGPTTGFPFLYLGNRRRFRP